MKINEVTIHNFRGISEMTFRPEHLNAFIGPCGSGKTSVFSAIQFALTGKMGDEIIRNGAKAASVKILLEDGTSIIRQREKGTGSVWINEKKTTLKSAEEFLEDKFGAPSSVIAAMCSIDHLETLGERSLNAFLLSILPAAIQKGSLFSLIEEQCGRHLTEDEKVLIGETLPDEAFGLDEIDAAYKKLFADRRAEKRLVDVLTARSAFDAGRLPKESKEELLRRRDALIARETSQMEYAKRKAEYRKAADTYAKAASALNAAKEELSACKDVQKPDPDVYNKAVSDRKQFEDAIRKIQEAIATFKQNVNLYKRTLAGLDTQVCPISSRLICTTDKTAVKDEITSLLAKNEQGIMSNEAFLARCREQVEKRDKMIEAYQKSCILYEKKKGIEDRIKKTVLPVIPAKPEPVPEVNPAEKREIEEKLSCWNEYAVSLKNKEELKAESQKLLLLEFAVQQLDVKTGIRAKILRKALSPIEDACNQNADRLRKGFKLTFFDESGIHVSVFPRENADPVGFEDLSTGEKLFTDYLLISAVNSITGIGILAIDSMDKLDSESMRNFLSLLKEDASFDNIFLAAVDHEDTKTIISEKKIPAISLPEDRVCEN